jgi:hypothetical protein
MRGSRRSASIEAAQLSFLYTNNEYSGLTQERHIAGPPIAPKKQRKERTGDDRDFPKPPNLRMEGGFVGRGRIRTKQADPCPDMLTFFAQCAFAVLHPSRAAMPSFPQFSPTRIRSYIFRLPLCTRVLVAAILGLWIATIPFPWLREFAQLEPAKMDFTQSM